MKNISISQRFLNRSVIVIDFQYAWLVIRWITLFSSSLYTVTNQNIIPNTIINQSKVILYNADEVKTAQAYAYTAIALYESFISCWDEKYQSSYIRPVTAINEMINPKWLPYLQTPPFPEYTSGHSTISATLSTVLTALFGANFAFHDNSDLQYIGMEKDFNSFEEAAAEASVSRIYGGIHYRFTADVSPAQGKKTWRFYR